MTLHTGSACVLGVNWAGRPIIGNRTLPTAGLAKFFTERGAAAAFLLADRPVRTIEFRVVPHGRSIPMNRAFVPIVVVIITRRRVEGVGMPS